MSLSNQLQFSVKDIIDNVDLSPSHIPLSLLGEFQRDVSDFLKGSTSEVNPAKVLVSIEAGSLALIALGLLAATTLWRDLSRIHALEPLDSIDPKRAKVLLRWQDMSQQNPNRQYFVADESKRVLFTINSDSNLKFTNNIWVHVEKYIHGTVYDIGGRNKANVHLQLEDGTTLPPIASTQEYLKEYGQNRLYQPTLVHLIAEENLLTHELRNLTLLGFESYQPIYDEDEFNRMVERGTKAWAGIENPTAWLETLRGH